MAQEPWSAHMTKRRGAVPSLVPVTAAICPVRGCRRLRPCLGATIGKRRCREVSPLPVFAAWRQAACPMKARRDVCPCSSPFSLAQPPPLCAHCYPGAGPGRRFTGRRRASARTPMARHPAASSTSKETASITIDAMVAVTISTCSHLVE